MTTLPFELGRYRCTKKLGEDGLAEVFLAEKRGEEGFKKTYTLTCFRPEATALPGFMPRLTRDALRNAELEHGGVVRVLGFERLGDLHVLVSEHVDGLPLRHLLDRLATADDAVPWNVAAHVAIEVAKTLDYAHGARGDGAESQGVVHGAISPSNVLLTWEGAVRVASFGLAITLAEARARLDATDPSERAYQSPEQLAGQRPGPQGDLFSLGTVLYEMLAGRPLYEIGPDGTRRLGAAPARSQGEGAALLKPVLKQLLAPRLSDRFAEAEDVVLALQRILVAQGKAVSVTPLVVWLEQVTRAVAQPSADDDFGAEATTVRSTEDRAAPAPPAAKDAAPPEPPWAALLPELAEAALLPEPAPPAQTATPAQIEPPTPAAQAAAGPVAMERRCDSGVTPSHGAGQAEAALLATSRPRSAPALKGALLFTILWALAGTAAAAYLYLEGPPWAAGRKGAQVRCPPGPTSPPGPPGPTAKQGGRPEPIDGMRGAAPDARLAASPERPRPDADRPGADRPLAPERGSPTASAPRPGEPSPGQGEAARPAPAAEPGDPEVVPGPGEPGAGEITLATAPKEVLVTFRGRVLGQTPLRIRAKPGRPFLLVLNKEKHQVQTFVAKTSGYGGQSLRALLPPLQGTSPLGVEGQSRVTLRCRTPGVHRIYLNGRDTGRNCPASLRVGLGTNNAGIFFPEDKRTDYKFFRAAAGSEVILSFDH